MIMTPSDAVPASMRQQQPGRPFDLPAAQSPIQPAPQVTRLLAERLELVEELWETVLRSECPPGQAERLLQLKQLSDPVAADGPGDQPTTSDTTDAIVALIRAMDLAEAIAAARAFSLYFQLVNILEQHIEEDSYLASLRSHAGQTPADPFQPPLASQTDPATFRQLFERLRSLNVPPAQVENLLRDLDLRLVFTAHPTEIVRHTVRHKQRRVAALIQKLQQDGQAVGDDAHLLRQQLE